jgi:bla regulator protein BlaR1
VERVGALSRRLGIRRTVKMVESGLVRVPMVMGQLRPVIFIPLGLINHLPAGEMEAVVLHELAHIRRRDQLVNIIQQVMECLFFFNPGLLWVSSLMRDERENCCDDVAIAETRDRVEFVRALVRFKEHSLREVTLAFPGNRRQLFHRVLRISRQENRGLGGRERMVLLVSGGLLLLWLAAVKGVGSAVKPVAYPVAVAKVAPVPAELVSVLKARQQVTENMEWVQGQLSELHKMDLRSQKRERSGKAGQLQKNKEQVTRNQVQVEMNLEQDIRNRERSVTDVEQAGTDVEQAEKNMLQDRSNLAGKEELKRLQLARKAERAQRNSEQAQRNDEQARRNEEQARRNEEQDRLNREQAENKVQELKNQQEAERNRMQAELDRQQAQRDREQADRDRAQADRDRQQAEQDRQQAERERVQGERDRQQALLNRQQAEKERKQVEMMRVQAEKDRKQSELVRVLAERERAEALGRADSKGGIKD